MSPNPKIRWKNLPTEADLQAEISRLRAALRELVEASKARHYISGPGRLSDEFVSLIQNAESLLREPH